jgi:short-subunit dehydrogenase involved in D-alanine esterification of teichoic acids
MFKGVTYNYTDATVLVTGGTSGIVLPVPKAIATREETSLSLGAKVGPVITTLTSAI